jgi:glycosyltransferase involved in cell wall biosynthesis
MESWKGHRLLLEAARRMNEAGTNAPWEIWIVGGPQRPTEEAYLQSLHGQVANCGLQTRVRWLGQRSDVPQILADADVFCQPNAAPEPLGVVFLEALGQGLPVVSINFGGAQEVIPAAAGILVEPGDIAALAAALRGLIDNPAERQRLQGAGTAHARRLADPLERLRDLQRALSPSSSRDVRFHGHR